MKEDQLTYEYKDEILRRFGIFKYIKQEEEDTELV